MRWSEFYRELWFKTDTGDDLHADQINQPDGMRVEVMFAPQHIFDGDGVMYIQQALKEPTYTVHMTRNVKISGVRRYNITVVVSNETIPGVRGGTYRLVFDEVGMCEEFPSEMFVDEEVPARFFIS